MTDGVELEVPGLVGIIGVVINVSGNSPKTKEERHMILGIIDKCGGERRHHIIRIYQGNVPTRVYSIDGSNLIFSPSRCFKRLADGWSSVRTRGSQC